MASINKNLLIALTLTALVSVFLSAISYRNVVHNQFNGFSNQMDAGEPPSPLHGKKLLIYKESYSNQEIAKWVKTHPKDETRLSTIVNTPQAMWFGDWNKNVVQDVKKYVQSSVQSSVLPVIVLYNIPLRDCGGFSGGGAANALEYSRWLSEVSSGIENREVIVIVEPDSIGGMDCLSQYQKDERIKSLSEALQVMRAQKNAHIYIDAGNPHWLTPTELVRRLKLLKVDDYDGFALNVSQFFTTSENITYGTEVSKLLGGKHFIIDTSRNGNGPTTTNQWCNPPGRALGQSPSTETGNELVDAFLWVKIPGESDGECEGGPRAGVWWPGYLLGLIGTP